MVPVTTSIFSSKIKNVTVKIDNDFNSLIMAIAGKNMNIVFRYLIK